MYLFIYVGNVRKIEFFNMEQKINTCITERENGNKTN